MDEIEKLGRLLHVAYLKSDNAEHRFKLVEWMLRIKILRQEKAANDISEMMYRSYWGYDL